MSRRLRWTEQAVDQLGAIAEYVSRSSPVYAEQLVQRLVHRLEQVRTFPESGAPVPEATSPAVRQVLEWPYRIIYRPQAETVIRLISARRATRAERAQYAAHWPGGTP